MDRRTPLNWRWLLLAFASFLLSSHGIQVAPDTALQNATAQQFPQHTPPVGGDNATSVNVNDDGMVADSELSASERNRRLIPYMAFYLPPDFPINQQYSLQRPKVQHQAPPPTAIESAGPLPPPTGGHIPLSSAYMHHVAGYAGDGRYPPSAGDVYHAITYGGPEQPPLRLKEVAKNVPLLHLLPPGHAHAPPTHRHKTVQHFPPTTAASVPQHQSPAPGYHRPQPAKQAKINLSPFSPSNTLPGHFIPIIYTPLSGANSNNNNNAHNGHNNGNTITYRYETAPDAAQQQQPQTLYKSGHKQQQQNYHHHQPQQEPKQQQPPQQIGIEYPLPPSASGAPAYHQQQHQQQQQQQHQHQLQQQHQQQQHYHQTQYIEAATPPSPTPPSAPTAGDVHLAAPHATPSPTAITISAPQAADTVADSGDYQQRLHHPHPHAHHHQSHQHRQQHVINEAPPPPSTQQLSVDETPSSFGPKSQSPSQQQQQQQQSQHQQQQKNHLQPAKQAHFYHSAEEQQQPAQYYHPDSMTPQEKYVQYLQQRIRYNKQKLQRERAKQQHELYVKQQQQQQQPYPSAPPPQLFVISSTTAAPPSGSLVAVVEGGRIDMQSGAHNYAPAQPIRHAVVYGRPEQAPSGKAEAAPGPHGQQQAQQVVHIPVRAILNDFGVLLAKHAGQHQPQPHPPHHHQNQQQQRTLRPPQPHYASVNSGSKSQYIDFLIEEPKQALDEEQQKPQPQQTQPQQTHPHPNHHQHHHHPHHHHQQQQQQQQQSHHHQQQQQQQQSHHYQRPQQQQQPPQAAYVVISTVAPPPPTPHSGQPKYSYISTVRPAFKQASPTLRLQSVPQQQPTRRPPTSPSPPAHVSYVTIKPSYGNVLLPAPPTPTPAIKLKPSYQFEPSPSSKSSPPPSSFGQVEPHQAPNVQHKQQPQPTTVTAWTDPNQLPDIRSSSLAEILHKLQESNHLPQTLTPDNIDNSIKTLVTILNNLKETQTIVPNPPQHHEPPAPAAKDYDDYASDNGGGEAPPKQQDDDLALIKPQQQHAPSNKHPGPSTGRAGIDYPNYADIPKTSFDCTTQRYKGFFGDPETNCQVWHYCDLNGGKASFLCPNGTIFSQIALTCDWWFNVKCSTTAQLYVLNERLYKYILPFTPKFPEDYSGPLVDKYLALKFQEMEEKMRVEKQKVAAAAAQVPSAAADASGDNHLEASTTLAEKEGAATTDTTQPPAKHVPVSVNSQVGEQSSERNRLIDDEVDDIAQRGSIDTYDTATPTKPSTPGSDVVAGSLSLRPIVVSSSTAGPDYEDTAEEQETTRSAKQTTEGAKHLQQLEQQQQQRRAERTSPDRETTKISVEKVEVIEIKSDGTSGHLLPELLFDSVPDKQR